MASRPTPGPPTDPADAVDRIALRIGSTPVARVDVAAMLSGVCAALPGAVGVAGAALVLTEPADPRDPGERHVFASDPTAARLGLIQHRAGHGPVPAAVRGDRALVVPDLTVSGPPGLAAAAADCGLTRSLVVPVPGPSDGSAVGGLQLLSGADSGLDESTARVLWSLVAALSARLADVREIARLRRDAGEAPAPPTEPDGGPEEAPDVTGTVALPRVGGRAGGSVDETTVRLHPVPGPVEDTPARNLFAAGETGSDTPPIGQAELGWEGPDRTPPPPAVPARPLPSPVRTVGRRPPRPAPLPTSLPLPAPEPGPARGTAPVSETGPLSETARTAAVPAQRSGPAEHATVPAVTAATPSTPAVDADDPDEPTRRVPRHRLRDDA